LDILGVQRELAPIEQMEDTRGGRLGVASKLKIIRVIV
jgi:hypothetical protein